MLLAPTTLELVPLATEILALASDDPRFKLELPASQVEIVTPPSSRVADAASALLEARRLLAARVDSLVRLASAGVHPSPGSGELNRLPRYEPTIAEFGPIARRQLSSVRYRCMSRSVPRIARSRSTTRHAPTFRYWPRWQPPRRSTKSRHWGRVRAAEDRAVVAAPGDPPAIASWDDYAEVSAGA